MTGKRCRTRCGTGRLEMVLFSCRKRTWGIDIGHDPETGKRRQQTLTVRGTKIDTERKLRDMLTLQSYCNKGFILKLSKSDLDTAPYPQH
jgi:hypothetical protein